MSRVEQYLGLIDDPDAAALDGTHPDDLALRTMLVTLAFTDGLVAADEFALLRRVRPDLDDQALLPWVKAVATHPRDLGEIVSGFTETREAWGVLRLAARMVCMDGLVTVEEISFLENLRVAMRLPEGAPRKVVDEIVADGGEVSLERVRGALRHMFWRDLVPQQGAPEGPLAACVPRRVVPLCVMRLGDEEVGALFEQGIAAVFDQGPRFVRWEDVATFTRVPVRGAGFHLHTLTGEHLSATPLRMRDLGALLDFLFD